VPLSPDRVKRTTAIEGIRALSTLVARRFTGGRPEPGVVPSASESAAAERSLK
jgi:hypothetical protein